MRMMMIFVDCTALQMGDWEDDSWENDTEWDDAGGIERYIHTNISIFIFIDVIIVVVITIIIVTIITRCDETQNLNGTNSETFFGTKIL